MGKGHNRERVAQGEIGPQWVLGSEEGGRGERGVREEDEGKGVSSR